MKSIENIVAVETTEPMDAAGEPCDSLKIDKPLLNGNKTDDMEWDSFEKDIDEELEKAIEEQLVEENENVAAGALEPDEPTEEKGEPAGTVDGGGSDSSGYEHMALSVDSETQPSEQSTAEEPSQENSQDCISTDGNSQLQPADNKLDSLAEEKRDAVEDQMEEDMDVKVPETEDQGNSTEAEPGDLENGNCSVGSCEDEEVSKAEKNNESTEAETEESAEKPSQETSLVSDKESWCRSPASSSELEISQETDKDTFAGEDAEFSSLEDDSTSTSVAEVEQDEEKEMMHQPSLEEKPQPSLEEKPQPSEEEKPEPSEEEKPQPSEEEKPQPSEEKPQPSEEEKPQPSEEAKYQPFEDKKHQPSEEEQHQPSEEEKAEPSKEKNHQPSEEEKSHLSEEKKSHPSEEEKVISLEPVSNNSDSEEEDEEGKKENVAYNHSKQEAKPEAETKAEVVKPTTEPINYVDALEQLSVISASAKAFDEDHQEAKDLPQGKKRSLEPSSDPDSADESKRVKSDELDHEIDAAKKKVKKRLRHLARSDIEELVAQKVVEVLSCRSEVGELRQRCDQMEEMNEKWRRKTQAWRKMFQDLNTVMKRYITDVQRKDRATPIKITRSVGLQVLADSSKRKATAVAGKPAKVARQAAPQPPMLPQEGVRHQGLPMAPVVKAPSIHAPGGALRLANQASLMKQSGVTISPIAKNIQKPMHAPVAAKVTFSRASPQGHAQAPVVRPMLTVQPPIAVAPPVPSNPSGRKVIDVVDLSDDDDVPAAPNGGAPRQLQKAAPISVSYTYLNGGGTATAPIISGGAPPALTPAQRGQIIVSPMLNRNPQQQQQQQPIVINRNQMIPVTTAPSPTSLTIQRSAVSQQQQTNGIRQIIFNGQNPAGTPRLIAPLHPAPPPDNVVSQQHSIGGLKKIPQRPILKISCLKAGIVLSWDMKPTCSDHASVKSYQIFAYQESSAVASPSLWKKVGDVKALPLPMACTLTQFTKGNKYHFAVRAQDAHSRVSLFSEPQSIALN